MQRFRKLIVSALTLSLIGVCFFAFQTQAAISTPGTWAVLIDSLDVHETNVTVHGTVYFNSAPTGANVAVYTQHIKKTTGAQVQNGGKTNSVTDSSGRFSINITNGLVPATTYLLDAVASIGQTILATSSSTTFTTNAVAQGQTGEWINYNDPQPLPTPTTITLKFKVTNLVNNAQMTVDLNKDGTLVQEKTASVTPNGAQEGYFQVAFTGLTAQTTYDVVVSSSNNTSITLHSVGTEGATIPSGVIQVSTSTPILTMTTAAIPAIIKGNGATQVELQAQAKKGSETYAIVSSVYNGMPSALGNSFEFFFSGLTSGTTYTYQVMDTGTSTYLTSKSSFTTPTTDTVPGSTGTDGTGIIIDPNFQSAVTQTPGCKELVNGEYCMLAPIPFPGINNGKLNLTTDAVGNNGLANFINAVIQFAIAFAGVLSLIMIIMGGITYATQESMTGKSGAKNMIMNAIFGLLLALCSYLILKTINPALVNIGVDIAKHEVLISSTDTSTGSSTSLCISAINPPNPDSAVAGTITLNPTMTSKYIPARDSLNLPTGIKLLITAQTAVEGFSETPTPGTKSYRTNNPGNIGNKDDGTTKTYPTLLAGVAAQRDIVTNVAGGSSTSYPIGGKNECALGKNVAYDGSLYEYLRIYSTGARQNNNYVNAIIGYFKANGKTITARTKMSDIAAMN